MKGPGVKKKNSISKKTAAQSVLLFLVNYILLIGLITLFVLMNSLDADSVSFQTYFTEYFSDAVYLLCSLFVLFLIIYFYYFFEKQSVLSSPKDIFLIFILLDVSIIVCYLFGFFFNIYSRPVALLALLALLLLGRRDAIFLNTIFALEMLAIDHFTNFSITGVNENAAAMSVLITFSAGMIGIFVGSKVKTRIYSFLTGFAVCIPILLMIACLEYDAGIHLLYRLLYGLEGGICSAVLFMALLPVFEVCFNCITDYRLRELTDHDSPLMRQLKEHAYGTFNHSIVVAHLAEACAIELNEDTSLARACAYYHDVGKLRQPEYFTENQSGYNPHDELSPELSVDIIRSHAKDGYDLIRARRLPKVLADVALQHHGTMPIKFFYAKALKMTDGEAKIEDYSYAGPKPQTKIAAIIMIADACEAVSRTLPDRSPEHVEKSVRSIIEERLDSGQFDECDITMGDLTLIKNAIVNCLAGVYHSRIEYPKLKLGRKRSGE